MASAAQCVPYPNVGTRNQRNYLVVDAIHRVESPVVSPLRVCQQCVHELRARARFPYDKRVRPAFRRSRPPLEIHLFPPFDDPKELFTVPLPRSVHVIFIILYFSLASSRVRRGSRRIFRFSFLILLLARVPCVLCARAPVVCPSPLFGASTESSQNDHHTAGFVVGRVEEKNASDQGGDGEV